MSDAPNLPAAADPRLSPEDRARRVKVLLFDVDGVLTDGGITVMPGPAPTARASR